VPLSEPIPEGGTFLLSPLRSTVFRKASASISQERQQHRTMRGLQTNHGPAGFNRGSGLQAHSST
jgi:hypothetical protein